MSGAPAMRLRDLAGIFRPMPKQLQEMNAEELQHALAVRVFEANLIVRALSLQGVKVDVDLVERVDGAHPNGRTEILVRTEQ